MKKLLAIILTFSMLTLSLCACGAQSEQSGSSKTDNNDNSSQQTLATEEVTIQPVTEPDYENTNFIAQPPQGTPNYTVEEISLEDAATSSGYSITDSKFRINDVYTESDYIVLNIVYSDYNSPDCSVYDVIYDLDGNMIANVSNIAAEEGYHKSGQINGVYGDYAVLVLSLITAPLEDRYALYNLKSKEIKYLEYDTARLDNGIIIVGNKNREKDNNYRYGALDLDLNVIIPLEYDNFELASPQLFIANKDGKFGLIDFNNKIVADFKYKEIQSFIGIDKNESRNCIQLIDFEKNINKKTIAVTDNDEYFLIDKSGATKKIDLEVFKEFEIGRTIAYYDDILYIKQSDGNSITTLDGELIAESFNSYYDNDFGFINGYCTTQDKNGNCSLINTKGETVYSEQLDSNCFSMDLLPVDQNGLFSIVYNLKSGIYKTRILDLSGNEIYTSESIYPIGNGMYKKLEENTYRVFRITEN